MDFRDVIDAHIDDSLAEGGLPEVDVLLEVDVAGKQQGPRSTPSVGPVGSSKTATYNDAYTPPRFSGAGQRQIPAAHFQGASQRQVPPARFPNAARISGAAVEAVFDDLGALLDSDE